MYVAVIIWNQILKELSKCCPNDYFERAIQYMKEHMDTPVFYVFSDDMDYVKENIKLEDAFYIDGNRGE